MGESMTSFSDLPGELVRSILFSYYWTPTNPLTKTEKARLSDVSTQFYSLMQNSPNLRFKLGMSVREDLQDSLSTLIWYQEENIHLDSLTIEVGLPNLCGVDDIHVLDECIKLGARKRLTNLVLSLQNNDRVLPEPVFKVESLQRLHSRLCHLNPKRTPMWPNLRELGLNSFSMKNEEAFENLIKGCPFIKTLILGEYNWGVGRFSFKVSNLRSLKKLSATNLGSYQSIDLRESAATNLESIECNSLPRSNPCIYLGKQEYPHLRRLDLCEAWVLEGNFFTNFGCKFPRLESLSLGPRIATISLSSSSLKEICVDVNTNVLKEACFDVPNIVSFKYSQKCRSTTTLPKLLFTDRSGSRGVSKSVMESEEGLDDVQKQLFSHLNMPFEASIRVEDLKEVKFLNHDKYWIKDLPPPGFVTGIRKFTITHILDVIFMIYRPQTITYIYDVRPYDDGGDYVNHDVKYPLDDARSSPNE